MLNLVQHPLTGNVPWIIICIMTVEYDPAKRQKTLNARGLDFNDAEALFRGDVRTIVDDRRNYGEARYISFGYIDGEPIVMVWTERTGVRRIISMRRAHKKEMKNAGME